MLSDELRRSRDESGYQRDNHPFEGHGYPKFLSRRSLAMISRAGLILRAEIVIRPTYTGTFSVCVYLASYARSQNQSRPHMKTDDSPEEVTLNVGSLSSEARGTFSVLTQRR